MLPDTEAFEGRQAVLQHARIRQMLELSVVIQRCRSTGHCFFYALSPSDTQPFSRRRHEISAEEQMDRLRGRPLTGRLLRRRPYRPEAAKMANSKNKHRTWFSNAF